MSEPIKLFLDEDAQRTDLIKALRARHIDVDTVSDANLLGQPDEVILKQAAEQGRVLFTFNRGDFFQLHTEWLKRGSTPCWDYCLRSIEHKCDNATIIAPG